MPTKSTVICPVCQKEFTPKIPTRVFCSVPCANKVRRKYPTTMTLEERFWSKVDRSGGPDACWEWKTGKAHWYGQFVFESKKYIASRLAYTLAKGPITDGLWVLHSCDNPPCCNPNHLRLGTCQDNIADRDARGRTRQAFGEGQGTAKLTEKAVREIYESYASGKENTSQLATRFNIGLSAIANILTGTNWKHLQLPPLNTREMAAHNHPRGEGHHATKLTAEQVREIKAKYKTGNYTRYQLAEMFNCGYRNIGDIVTNRRWSHI